MNSYHAQISPEFINHKWLSDDICNVHVLVANGMQFLDDTLSTI